MLKTKEEKEMHTISKKALSTSIVVLFLLSILAVVMPVSAAPVTFHVYAGQLIQPVIDNANTGDTIIVHAGTYSDEQLIINKALTILGDRAVLKYSLDPTIPYYYHGVGPFYFAIDVTADGVKISGFKIAVTNANYLSAIDASDFSGTVIDNNIIEATRWGVSGMATANVRVINNKINSTTPVYYTNAINIAVINNVINSQPLGTGPIIGIYLPSYQQEGILSGAQVRNNQIHSAYRGIVLGNTSDVAVKYNIVFADSDAIYASGSSSNLVIANNLLNASWNGVLLQNMGMTAPVVTGNIVSSDFRGIELHGVAGANIKYNVVNIKENTRDLPGGINIFDSTGSQIAANIVTGDFISGIFMSGETMLATLNTIENNIVIGVYRYDPVYDDAGIRLWYPTSGNTVKRNIILRVDLRIEDLGSGNIIIP
jgi:hypothetical protein